ncbi:glycosyltransferase family 2 protein [Methylobacter tundripaludum]|uniref:Glycosyl transferase family 2 n=1 Tax=Methylobacter tundripaludum (strain ATCC BAA-1195 / DSM 17260 / SV96) TaxID=697282 RepID=G3J0M8_METTV|nr:glycosyltransferase family 2 protein [Methylobacter tundripaludum]EGW20750.1 glycosyl transferase family 2 [Methylobacter tundripaludum SV96]
MKSISVIIVSWNARDYLRDCLNSIRQTGASCVQEVIVVDNASKDGSPEMVEKEFPEVTLIRAGANLGFARANNLAMKCAKGSMYALVNSDVIIHPGCLQTLASFLDQHNDVGLVGPRVIGGDGNLQRTCRKVPTVWNTACRILALDRIFPDWQLFSGFEVPHRNHAKCMEAEVLSGCFCVARKQAVDEVDGMDEQFFFYGEDIDWCKRFRDAGWKVMFVPEATATHFGGASTSNAPLRYSIEILRATLKYWRKHHGIAGHIVCYLLILAHHGSRLLTRGVKRSLGMGSSIDSRHKLKEDTVCLRWLLTGKGI